MQMEMVQVIFGMVGLTNKASASLENTKEMEVQMEHLYIQDLNQLLL